MDSDDPCLMRDPQKLQRIGKMSRKALMRFLLPCCALLVACAGRPENRDPGPRPNILLLVADDLGYSDLGCFGGEIHTPYLDSLARQGIRFSRFHTAPMCAPTRAMLLSGNDNHIAGVGRQAAQANIFGYEGYLTERVATIPALLQRDGYSTMMAGKWHLGGFPEANPAALGFDRSFVMLEGVGNHFNGRGIFGEGSESHYTEDGRPTKWPEGHFSTDFYTDKLLQYLEDNREEGRPFFAYAAYTAPHWPLQVSEEYWKKYEEVYKDGYEALRSKRLESLVRAGLVPEGTPLPDLHPDIVPWDALPEAQRVVESRKMALYAGMVENLDRNIGRLIDYLRQSGQYENTLIIFMSDNGAAGEDYYNEPGIRPYINPYFTDQAELMGRPESFISYGPPWAEAATAPFRYFKEYATNGGTLAPLIVSAPWLAAPGTINEEFATVMDIAPTAYALSGTQYPDRWKGSMVYPLRGASLLPLLRGEAESAHPKDYIFALEHAEFGMVRKGDWKITNTTRPLDRTQFELYDLSRDLGEQHDLKQQAPEKFAELLAAWDAYRREVRLQLSR